MKEDEDRTDGNEDKRAPKPEENKRRGRLSDTKTKLTEAERRIVRQYEEEKIKIEISEKRRKYHME